VKQANAKYKGVAAYLPERVVTNEELEKAGFDISPGDVFFKGVQRRHWASKHETSVYMGYKAAENLLEEQSTGASEIDLIICSALIGDNLLPHPVCGIQHKLGACNATAITLDTGCASFVSGLIYASAMIRSGYFKKIVLISISNFSGRAQSKALNDSVLIPGDGAGAILICASDDKQDGLQGWWEKSLGEYHQMLSIRAQDEAGNQTNIWEPHKQIAFWFDNKLIDTLKMNGRELVPKAIRCALDNAGIELDEIDICFTHQPNEFLVNCWREDLGLTEKNHYTTLATCGNLFQASIPVTMASAINAGRLKQGDRVALGSFSFAGELAAGAVIQFG